MARELKASVSRPQAASTNSLELTGTALFHAFGAVKLIPGSLSSRAIGSKMKMKTKLMLIVPVVTVLIAVILAPLLSGCATTKQYPMPFAKAEAALLNTLHLDKTQVLNNTVMAQARAEGGLEKSMSMKLFAIDLHDYAPNQHLSFTANHIYNIGANGGQYIRFDLRAIQPDLTEVSVNYTDRWVGMFPPFAFLNPGPFREKKIHNIIWQTELPTTDSTLSTEGAPSVEK